MTFLNSYKICLFIPFIVLFFSCEHIKTPIEVLRPNIVLIIADDQNWDDSGAYGNTVIRTPNIDKLAQDGMRFTQAFLTTSSCSPSRTSIRSGKYPHNTDAEQLHWPLPEGHKTFVDQLNKSGYWTGLAGKYHLGEAVKDDFDSIIPVSTAGFQVGPDGKSRKAEGDGSGCEAWVQLLQSRDRSKPFFTWLAAVDPHRPYHEGIIDKLHDAKDVIVPPYLPDNDSIRKDLALYYDEISRMDKYIGDVIDELEKQGVAENTMVLFISDNGRPFPRDKTTLYEGGIKTPWIVKWPSKIKAGTTNTNLVSSIDIAPTFIKMAGLEPLEDYEGLDFAPLLMEGAEAIRNQIYAEDHWHDYEDYARAIRTSEFKYIKNFYPDLPNTPSADAFRSLSWQSMLTEKKRGALNEAQLRCFQLPRDEEELYDIRIDPYELKNLAYDTTYLAALEDMRTRLKKKREITNDSIPVVRTPDDFDRKTGLPTPARIRPRPSKDEMMKDLLSGG